MNNLICDFSINTLLNFFKAKVSSFKPLRENLNTILSDNNFRQFSELNKIGEIDFNGIEDLLVFACKTDNTLTERSSKKRQFEIAKKVLKEDFKDGAIFVFYDATGNFRFSFIRKNYGNKEQKFTNWKRFTYYIEKDKTNKTFKDRIGNCDFSSLDAIQKAFSVEKLTEDFYKELFAWYIWTLSEEVGITYPNNTEIFEDDRIKLEEQIIRLITRLLFVWFIKQNKLVPAGLFEIDHLSKVLKDFNPNSKEDGSYYNAILQNLFFATLNKAIKERGFAQAVGERDIKTLYRYAEMFQISEREVIEVFNDIPFLNGGLFECLDKDKRQDGVKYALDGFSRNAEKANGHFKHRAFIPNCVFFDERKGIIPLLERYNFTVEENAPNEIQVALDPELLGNVFENLLGAFNPETKETARKQSGSFYTPREIVSYMVDESLIFYLLNAFPNLKEENIRHLFTEEDLGKEFAKNHSLCEEISQKLKEIKILDPACGSGAFPMGILNRMVSLLEKLACHKEKTIYDLKLHLIEECIYGVDIQTIAVQISKLRFFISLIVEQEEIDLDKPGENYKVITLPNLETKFVAANTLIGLASANKNLLDLNDKVLEGMKARLWDIRKQHFYAKSAGEKKRLRITDESLRDEIKDYISANASKPNTGFIQQLEYEITQLEKKRKNAEGELWVDETTKHTQVVMFDSVEKNPSIFKVDKNLEERKKIDARLKAIQAEIAKENNKSLNDGFNDEIKAIAKWNPYDQNASSLFFDVEWMFGLRSETTDTGCFDVVIGNPPYVSAPTMVKTNPLLRKSIQNSNSFSTLYQKWDLYIPFMELGLQQLSKNGISAMIIPYPFTNQTYGKKLRELIINKYSLREIVDLNGTKIFDSATVSNCIPFISRKYKIDSCAISQIVHGLKIEQTFQQSYNDLVQDEKTAVWNLSKEKRGNNRYAQMSILGDFCYLSKGMVLNADENTAKGSFVKEDLISDIHDEIHNRKYIEAKDIEKYRVKRVRYLEYNTERCPAKLSRPTFKELYEQPKLMFNCLGNLIVYYDTGMKFLHNHSLFSAVLWKDFSHIDNKSISSSIKRYSRYTRKEMEAKSELVDLRYLIAILNSKYASNLLNNLRGGDYHIYPEHLRNFPIPLIGIEKQQTLISLVDKVISGNTENPNAEFISSISEIDYFVYKLYNLTREEVLIVDPEFSLSPSEYDNFKIE